MSGGNLQFGILAAAGTFLVLFVIIFFHHEHSAHHEAVAYQQGRSKLPPPNVGKALRAAAGADQSRSKINIKDNSRSNATSSFNERSRMKFLPTKEAPSIPLHHAEVNPPPPPEDDHQHNSHQTAATSVAHPQVMHEENIQAEIKEDRGHLSQYVTAPLRHGARRGLLVCNGERVDSEIIYWKEVPGDSDFESPITLHHEDHHDRYITFEYDQGGWNNIRMGLESLMVIAHATGRTLVIPPQQHLYLLNAQHTDTDNPQVHDEMGFEDFFDLNILRSHKGFHMMEMEDFLAKEAVTGGLKGILPPRNSTKIWGSALWNYLSKIADEKPGWMGRFLVLPAVSTDYDMKAALQNPATAERLKTFGGDRQPVYYDAKLQNAHHIHFPGGEQYRLLQHHYAFAFFADLKMQSYYRRFVRDFMRYKDEIQCYGAELVAAVRADARRLAPESQGEYYALHIRRGDLQFKEVKISATEIVKNLRFPNGTAIIPAGSVIYISTDDPDGICKNCLANRKPCDSYPIPKPVGCPDDPSWNAFLKAGWKIRFLRDYQKAGYIAHANPNTFGMIESIVCSRAKVFAGTYFSTFTGYIHRLRGYHGLGEATYYHHKQYVFYPQKRKSVGHGFSREWRSGWTDEEGQLI